MFSQHITYDALLEQHRAINTALQSRDPIAARTAVETHLDYVKQALADHQKAEANAAVAQLRLQHEAEKG
jgi:GntR family transcriptional repressor for pyruvate dehydrogenase complex